MCSSRIIAGVLAVCAALASVNRVWGVAWIGGEGDWNVGDNWAGGAPPPSSTVADIANGGTVCIKDGDTYSLGTLRIGGAVNPGTVVQTGGSLTLTGDKNVDNYGALGVGAQKNLTAESVYDLRGGSLDVRYYGQVGRFSPGTMLISGGAMTASRWFSIGRHSGGVGTMVVSGGTFTQTAEGTIVGEAGIGTLVVTNAGVFSSAMPLRIGEVVSNGDTGDCLVRVASGGTLSAGEIGCSAPGANPRGILELDGGHLVVSGSGATIPSFISNLKRVSVKDGGVFFDTQANNVGVVMAFEGDGLSEDFVKLGSGSLTLGGANTWKGRTIVSNGTLTAASPASLPGWDEAGRVTVCFGANVAFGEGWTPAQIAQARANLVQEQSADVVYNTQDGDVTVTENLALDSGVSKQGGGTLTLAGNNAYAGAVTVWAGLLRGDFGAGLDATQPLILRGGTYAPLTGDAVTNAVGTAAGQISFAEETVGGFSAQGRPLRVRLDTGREDGAMVWGAPDATPMALLLNGAEADDALSFENAIDLNGSKDVSVGVEAGVATLAGGVRDGVGGGELKKVGGGTLAFGAGTTNEYARFTHGDGTTVFAEASTNRISGLTQDGGEVRVDGGNVTVAGNITQNDGTMIVSDGEFNAPGGTFTMGCAIEHSLKLQMDGGRFNVAHLLLGPNYPGSDKEVVLNGGTMTIGSLQQAYGNRQDVCSFTQNGGRLQTPGSSSQAWLLGTISSQTASYFMNGGTADIGSDFVIASGGNARCDYTQGGGDFTGRRYVTLGLWTNSAGRASINGGTFTQSAADRALIVGERGYGRLEINDGATVTANGMLCIGKDASGRGEVVVNAGGTLNAACVKGGDGAKKMLRIMPGAKLAATGANGTLIDGIDDLHIASGAEIDVADRDMSLKLAQDANARLAGKARFLTHRWSFNGDLSDSVGGATAVMLGAAAFDSINNAVDLPGGKGAGAVNLGENLLPAEGDVTIELWAAQHGVQPWSRVFDIGSDNFDAMFMTWSTNNGINTDDVCFKTTNNGKDWRDYMAPYTLNTEFHIAMTMKKRADDLWDVKVYKQNAATGETLRRLEFTTTAGWSPSAQNQSSFYLGRSHASQDADACAGYSEVRIWNAALTEEELTTSAVLGADAVLNRGFTKTGSGALAMTGDVSGYSFDVQEGTLSLGNYAGLLHRWSFNGDLVDSVGGVTATMDGGAAFAENNSRVRLPGGAHGAGAVRLGGNLIPTNCNVTIEIWAAQQGIQKWSRIFDIGSDNYNAILFAWTAGTDIATDDICFKTTNNGKDWRDYMAPYTLGTEYHIAATFERRTDGLWNVKVYKQDAATGATLKTLSFTTSAGWSFATQNQSNFYLGRSNFEPDTDARADYNEVRIWSSALTEAQLSAMAAAGPDAFPVSESSEGIVGTDDVNVALAPGASLDLAHGSHAVRSVSGSGTVKGGALTADEIIADGVLHVAEGSTLAGTIRVAAEADGVCGRVAFAGALDARGLSVELVDGAVLSGSAPYVIATFAPGGFTGSFVSTSLPSCWRVSVNNALGEVRIVREGFSIFIR